MVLLKPLNAALEAGDPIYATILSTVANQDGRSSSMVVPSEDAQAANIRSACAQAGIAPTDVGYVEAHGTGTIVGDRIEASALGKALGQYRNPDTTPLIVGSVKTNIGHLEPAAGIAGLIKTTLAIHHQTIPANLHFEEPNPEIDFEGLRLKVSDVNQEWPRQTGKPLVAGVNSFGFGGANAHVIVSEAPEQVSDRRSVNSMFHSKAHEPTPANGATSVRPESDGDWKLFPISAGSKSGLVELMQAYIDFLNAPTNRSIPLAEFGYQLSQRRSHHSYRKAILANSRSKLVQELEMLVGKTEVDATNLAGAKKKLAFVFSGQGPQWWAMGRQLFETEPVFRNMIERCDQIMKPFSGWSLIEKLSQDKENAELHLTSIAQPSIFAIQVALAEYLASWGIHPDHVIGHSVGEIAAAYVSGILDLETACKVIVYRGSCMDKANTRGGMLAVGMSAAEAQEKICERWDGVCVAAVNAPGSVTISGRREVLEEIDRSLGDDVFHKLLRVEYAFHSQQMDAVKEDLLTELKDIKTNLVPGKMVGTVKGDWVDGSELGENYWWQNVRQGVLFADGIQRLIDAGCNTFVEISAHPALTASIRECLSHADHKAEVIPTLRRHENEHQEMLRCLGGLYEAGFLPDWKKSFPVCDVNFQLPKYPWQRQSLWYESEENRNARLGINDHPYLGRRTKSAEPVWQAEINRQAHACLWDHVVQGHPVFPAAAYLEIGFAVARQIYDLESCVLEDVELRKAMFLPESPEHQALVQTVFDPDTSEFRVFGKTTADDEWSLYSVGKIRAEAPDDCFEPFDVKQANKVREVSLEEFYGFCSEKRIDYGPAFQGVAKCWITDRGALGELQAPQSIEDEVDSFSVHPSLLDAGLQVTFQCATEKGIRNKSVSVPLPVRMNRVTFYRPFGSSCHCDTQQTYESPEVSLGDLKYVDASGRLCLRIDELMVQSIDDVGDTEINSIDDMTYETVWELAPLPQEERPIESADYIPTQQELEQAVADATGKLPSLTWSESVVQIEPQINQAISCYIAKAFRELGWNFQVGDSLEFDELCKKLTITNEHQQLVARFLDFLSSDGFLKSVGDLRWEITRDLSSESPEQAWNEALQAFPAYSAELGMIARCGERLSEILKGDLNSLEVIFPGGAMDTAEHLYQDSPSFKFGNEAVGNAVSEAVGQLEEGRVARILEIGGGTGATTSFVLPKLPKSQYEYVFTDISPAFFSRAKQKFQHYPAVECRVLNIENNPLDQEFQEQSFDIILATDVLHATADLKTTLANIKQLLSPNGLLIVNELNSPGRWFDFVFGLLGGWWRFTDKELRPDHPTLTRPQWLELLSECGFEAPFTTTDIASDNAPGHVVYLTRAADQDSLKQPTNSETKGRWLVFTDKQGVSEHLTEELIAAGGTVIAVSTGDRFAQQADGSFQLDPSEPSQFDELFSTIRAENIPVSGVVFCWGIDTPILDANVETLRQAEELGSLSLFFMLQALAGQLPGSQLELCVVTRGAQPVGRQVASLNVAQTMLSGIARVAELEQSNLTTKMIDLSPQHSAIELESLTRELFAQDQGNEQEVAFRGRARYVPRIIRKPIPSFRCNELKPVSPVDSCFRLESGVPGMLDSLSLSEFREKPLGRKEVFVRVKAAGLNFRDVMKALGVYPTEAEKDDWLGDECAGEIVAVGEEVTDWKVGDTVLAITPSCFGSHVYVPAERLMRMPANISPEEAATLPITFLTAWYALHELGRIKKGERVLIHSATGGVGLAAIQIAKWAGAEIFATAGTEEKRAFLRALGVRHVMNSRTLAFGDEIRDATNGEGVDLVLNSLAGQAIDQGLRSLAPYGRFLEIGKRDIYGNSKLAMRVFRNNLSFFAIDLGKVVAERPQITATLWKEILPLFESEQLRPLPHRIYPITDAVGAFRFMSQAKHIGKIVFTTNVPLVEVIPAIDSSLKLDRNATYLITGGMGGFGIEVAKWMANQGAGQLILTSRSGNVSENAGQEIEAIRKLGVKVEVVRADVACEPSMRKLIDRIQSECPPLRGIFHMAMVLDDDVMVNLNRERFRSVTAPKVDGAWILAQSLDTTKLDFFVMFSSMVQLFGNMGQSNYCAANSFLVSLAHELRKQGTRALAIDWGRISDVGYVSRRSDLSTYFDKIGESGVRSDQGTYVIEQLLLRDVTHATAMNLYWPNFSKAFVNRHKAKFSPLLNLEIASGEASSNANIRHVISMAEPAQRSGLLVSYLSEELANVLGALPDEMEFDASLNTLGLDSLMTVELKNRIEQETGVNLPIMEIMRGPSLNQLSELILGQLENDGQDSDEPDAAIPTSTGEDETQDVQDLLDRIDELSEEEIELVMQQMKED